MPISDDNPFTRTERGLWSTLEANTQFADLVPALNRIKYCLAEQPEPEQGARTDVDFGAVAIVPSGFEIPTDRGQGASIFTQRYSIEIYTGDQRTVMAYNSIKWAITVALVQLFSTNMDTLSTTWSMPTNTKLMRVWPANGTDEFEATDETRKGWVSVMQIDIDFLIDETAITT